MNYRYCALVSAMSLLSSSFLFGQINFAKHTIDGNFDGAYAAYGIDLDGDGDKDIVASAIDAADIAWYENDGQQNFAKHPIDGSFICAEYLHIVDLDMDGDLDIVAGACSASGVVIAWFENNGQQVFAKHIIDSTIKGPNSVFAIDLDDDGDIDIVSDGIEDDDVLWFENDGQQGFTKHTIDGNFDNVFYVYAIDLDNDNDVDVLAAATEANQLAWWENDGSENFTKHFIATNYAGSTFVDVSDVDGDGDLDVMGTAFGNGGTFGLDDVDWFENDGNQNFAKHNIDANFVGANSFLATDLDGDHDQDFLGVAYLAGQVVWWENDGQLNFTKHFIDRSFHGVDLALPVDLDGDGDMDVLGAADQDDDIAWWENLSTSSAVSDNHDFIPSEHGLRQNYPNPFNPSTTIRYSFDHGDRVQLAIYDEIGHLVRTLVDQKQDAGDYASVWDGKTDKGRQVASGAYFYSLRLGSSEAISRRMIMMK